MVGRKACLAAAAGWLLAGCNVPEPPASTGGVHLDAGPCGRGVVISSSGSDYASTNISLADLEGRTVSTSFLSSGSVPAGASAALSGDVVLPLQTPPSGRVVLIDRQNDTLTWADPETGSVAGQLSVRGDRLSNPHDYVEVEPGKAYVTLYTAGALAVIDPRVPSWNATVPFEGSGELRAFPDRMLLAGNQVIALIQLFDALPAQKGEGRLVGIDVASDAVTWTLELAGLANCGGIAASPSGARIAVTCTGIFPDENSSSPEQLKRSAVVLLETGDGAPREVKRFDVAAQLGRPVGWTVAFASEQLVVGRVVGDLMSGNRDAAFSLGLASGEVKVLAESEPYTLGDVRCAAGCGAPCLLADAKSGTLRRWSPANAGDSGMVELEAVQVDTVVGLPPRWIGGF